MCPATDREVHNDDNDSEGHDERLDPGEAALGPRVGDLGEEEARVPGHRHNLIPEGEQGVANLQGEYYTKCTMVTGRCWLGRTTGSIPKVPLNNLL